MKKNDKNNERGSEKLKKKTHGGEIKEVAQGSFSGMTKIRRFNPEKRNETGGKL